MNKKLFQYLQGILLLFDFYLKSLKVKTIFFFPFYHTGGAERVHLDIVKSLGKHNSIVIFTGESYNDHFLQYFKNYAYVYNFKRYSYNFYFQKLFIYFLKNIGVFNRLSTLGCNSSDYYNWLPFINKNVKKIDLLHAFSYPDPGAEIYSINFVKYLDSRIVINKKTKNDYTELYSKSNINKKFIDRIKIINNATTIPNQQPIKDFYKNKLKVVYVGRIAKEKRVDIVIEIGKRLENLIDLEIYGPIETDYEDLHKFYKNNLTDFNELQATYIKADILLITSYREGFPVVILEAMSYATPCISTDVGGIAEHIKNMNNGVLIVNSNNKDTLVQKFVEIITKLHDNRSQLKALSTNAFHYAQEKFNYEVFNKEYKEILEHK